MKKLTIAIPTYNRIEHLKKNIKPLLPQISAECSLLVIDNHSDLDVAQSLIPVLQEYPEVDVRLVRNSVNIGGNANILRCIELCETEWVWILGDDDLVNSSAVQTILKEISRFPDAMLVNFTSGGRTRKTAVTTIGVTEFVNAWDFYADVLFISVNVYKASALRQTIKYGYQFTYSCGPHVAALLQALRDNGKCYMSQDSLLDGQQLIDPKDHWAPITLFLGKMILLELPLSNIERKALYTKIHKTPRIEQLVVYLVKKTYSTGDIQDALYLYDHIIYRTTYYDRISWMRIKAELYRVLIRYPRIGHWLLARMYNLFTNIPFVKNTKWNDYIAVDRFNSL